MHFELILYWFSNVNIAVQRYQHEESKRTIIRLEQAANAVTQRAIAGQGAFAVLNGRFSKYFIKKPEVCRPPALS